MSNQPLVSIIIPVYNVERYVEKCIESIKSQTLKNFEAIIVDDGSRDSSISLCEPLIKCDTRFKILHKNNGGLMSAWKYGLIHATGDFVGFVDSDDWIDPDMFETLYNAIKKYSSDIVISGYVIEDNGKRNKWERNKLFIYEGDSIKKDFIKDYCCSYFQSVSNPSINRWDKLYRKEILLNNLSFFNENVSLAEDFNTNIPVFLDANRIVLLPECAPYHYRYNPKSIVNTINPKAFVNVSELEKAWKRISVSKGFESLYVDSFIGNIIFEEVNRICKSVSFEELDGVEIDKNLQICNGYHYLNCYETARSTIRISIYNWIIQHKFFKLVKFLTIINKLR